VASHLLASLENQLRKPIEAQPGGGSGGQGVNAQEQLFMQAAALLPRLALEDADREKALRLLESFCDKSDRIFIRMLLLSAMLELGFPVDKCVQVCQTGLKQEEEYYRIQAAQLLSAVGEKHTLENVDLNALLRDANLGVRVHSACAHWRHYHQAQAVVPVLVDALDRNRHQSYYYAQILSVALGALGRIGPEAGDAAAAVTEATHDPDPNIAELATGTLKRIRK
jgi:hypothetical protein